MKESVEGLSSVEAHSFCCEVEGGCGAGGKEGLGPGCGLGGLAALVRRMIGDLRTVRNLTKPFAVWNSLVV